MDVPAVVPDVPPSAEPLSSLARLSRATYPAVANGVNGDNLPAGAVPTDRLLRPGAAAVATLGAVRSAGLTVTVVGADLRLHGEREPASDLLARVRADKAALVAILAGHGCRYCGEAIAWSRPEAVAFADGTAGHLACYEEAEGAGLLAGGRRAVAGAIGTCDEGEILTSDEAWP
jgi:hypothetical protein